MDYGHAQLSCTTIDVPLFWGLDGSTFRIKLKMLKRLHVFFVGFITSNPFPKFSWSQPQTAQPWRRWSYQGGKSSWLPWTWTLGPVLEVTRSPGLGCLLAEALWIKVVPRSWLLSFIIPITWVYGRDNYTILNGGYKLPFNWGAPPCAIFKHI